MLARVARWAPLVALAVISVAAPVLADETEPIGIAYRAPPGCPDEAAFAAQITGRTPRARVVEAGDAARTFTVTITQRGARAHGRLMIAGPKGPPALRDVEGASCDEVVAALGLVAALAIDPRASTAAKLPPPAPPPPPPPPPPAPHEALLPPARYTPVPWWGPLGMPLPAIARASPEPVWRPAWGLSFEGASAMAPGLVLTLGGFVEIARSGAGLVSPAFRLGMIEADSGFRATSAGHEARFSLAAARAEACPVRVAIVGWLAAYPCARIDVGQLTASGIAAVSLTAKRPWAAPGVVARLQAEILGRLRLEIAAGVNVPVVRDTFSFGPPGAGPAVLAVPAAGGVFAAGVGTHFP